MYLGAVNSVSFHFLHQLATSANEHRAHLPKDMSPANRLGMPTHRPGSDIVPKSRAPSSSLSEVKNPQRRFGLLFRRAARAPGKRMSPEGSDAVGSQAAQADDATDFDAVTPIGLAFAVHEKSGNVVKVVFVRRTLFRFGRCHNGLRKVMSSREGELRTPREKDERDDVGGYHGQFLSTRTAFSFHIRYSLNTIVAAIETRTRQPVKTNILNNVFSNIFQPHSILGNGGGADSCPASKLIVWVLAQ